jgi:hypothetical protein
MALVSIDWNPSRTMLRNFSLIGLVAFGLFGALVFWRVWVGRVVPGGAAVPTAYILWALGGYCGVCAAVAPIAAKPVYIAMSVVSFPIGLIISYVALGIMFYLIILPVGLAFRLIGRDAMNRKFDPSAASYWVKRQAPKRMERYFRQY